MKWQKKIALFLLLVLLLAYCAAWACRWAGCFTSADNEARIVMTRGTVFSIDQCARIFQTKRGRLPITLAELSRGTDDDPALLREQAMIDSWGHPIDYVPTGTNGYTLRSAGPDGRMGTRDDIHLASERSIDK